MKKRIIIGAVLLSTLFCTNTLAENTNSTNNNAMKAVSLTRSIFTVPANKTFKAIITAPVNSETANAGQLVTLVLSTDFYYNNNLVAPAGSSVTGNIIEVSKAKHGSINGKMMLRFTSIITPDGINIPISAILKTEDNTGVLIGGKFETSSEKIKDLSIKTVPATPIVNVNRGTSIAPAVGTGGGLVKSIWDKGFEVDIPVNSTLELILTQPITVKISAE